MLTNFLNLWILAWVVQTGVSATLGILGGGLGVWIAWRWRSGQSSESQLALERQAELVGAVAQVALILQVAGLGLAMLVTDHLVGGIRGAMCSFGVLASTRSGFAAVAAALAAAVASGLWVVLHRFDLQLELPVLTRRKFLALAGVAPLAAANLVFVLQFARELDFNIIASCCSVWLDDAMVNTQAAQWVGSVNLAGGFGLVTALLALAANALVWRHPQPSKVWAAAGLSGLAAMMALPAVLGVVAPYALAAPDHLCPFCLFHAQGDWIGWPLFAALFTAVVTGLGLAVIELHTLGVRSSGRDARPFQRRLALWSSLAWLGVLTSGTFPVIRYWIHSGGVSVFG